MASALAHPLFRAPSLDQGMHSNTSGLREGDIGHYHGSTDHARMPSPLPAGPMFLKDASRSSSASTRAPINNTLYQQPNFHTRTASLSTGRAEEYHRQQQERASLPGLTTLASIASTQEPQMRSFSATAAANMSFQPMLPVPTPGISGNNNMPPVCQNCETSTTPLWRRDESGSVLCNACGLFLKLHGRARPISLKTDVIKSRNRVKSANQGPKKQMNQQSLPASQSTDVQNGAHRRVSQMTAQFNLERSHSPISRTGTPSMHHDPNIAPQHMFDGVSLQDHPFQTPALPQLGSHPSPGSLDQPMTYEALLAQNAVLKTRVSELEVINMMFSDNETNLRRERDESMQAQEAFKRRIEELEGQIQGDAFAHPNKRARMDSPTGEHHREEQVVPVSNDAPAPALALAPELVQQEQ